MSYKAFAKALVQSGPSGATFGPTQPILDTSNPSHQFPSDLWSPGQEPFIYFNIRESVGDTLVPMGNISLYMPPTIKVNYGAGWDEFSMASEKVKALLGLDVGAAVESLSKGDVKDAIYNTAKSVAEKASIENFMKYSTGNVTEAMFGQSYAADVRKALNRGKRFVVNPAISMLYQGPRLRQFQLDFGLYARNSDESNSIQNVIKAFKLAMHPSVQSGSRLFFDFPYVFDIFFITPATDKMFNIKRAALIDMTVDYAGAGTPSFFAESWAPVDIQLSLTFKELELLTKEEIDQNY